MKKWPEVDVNIKDLTDSFLAQGKTKVPCGTVCIESVESKSKAAAKALVVRNTRNAGRIHIIEHGCNEK